MGEDRHMEEVERTLFDLSGAVRYAKKSIDKLRKDGAEPHMVEAMEQAVVDMEAAHKRLMQRTYFAVPKAEERQTTLV